MHFSEAGNPASNPKDAELYERMRTQPLKNAKLVAFGSTRRVGAEAHADAGLNVLANVGCQHVAIFGKSWDFHVREVLHTTLQENLNMICLLYTSHQHFTMGGIEPIQKRDQRAGGREKIYRRGDDHAVRMAQYFCRAVDTIVDHISLERSAGKTSPATGNYLSADVQQLRFRAAVGQSVSDLAQRLRRVAVFVGTAVDHHDLHEKTTSLK